MALANRLLPTIRNAVLQYGNSLILVQNGDSSYEYIDGDYVPINAETETPFKAGVDTISLKDIQGSIQQGDLEIIAVFDSGVTPLQDNKIKYLNDTYSIVDIMPLYFQDVLMAYQIIARK